jgi:hypothetical protein
MSFALSNVMIGSGQGVSIKDSGVALSSVGGGTIANSGNFARNYDTASGTTTVAHGLGKSPTIVNLNTMLSLNSTSGNTGGFALSSGSYTSLNGNNNVGIQIYLAFSAQYQDPRVWTDTTNASYIINTTGQGQSCVISVNSTNITFTWTRIGTGLSGGGFLYSWNAIA